jgi:Tol biopolymer transport system component
VTSKVIPRSSHWRRLMAVVIPLSVASALSVGVVWAQRAPNSHPVAITGTASVVSPSPSSSTVPTISTTSPPATAASTSVPQHVSPSLPVATAPVGHAAVVLPASTTKPSAVVSTPPAAGHVITTTGLWLMARDGSDLRRLLAYQPEAAAWSPDDSHIAVGRNGGIDLLSVADGTATRLVAFGGPVLIASLAWSPNGQLIAANVVHNSQTMGPTGGLSELVVVNAATGTTTSFGNTVGGAHPTWSASGCLGWPFRTVSIWCPGRPLLSVPPFPGSQELAWSPDGTRYAIVSSDDAAPGAIRTYAADGSGQVDLGDSRAINLQWAGDGRSIVFQSLNDKNGELWAQPVGGGPARLIAPGGFPVAVNGVDDGLILEIGHIIGRNAIVSSRVSDPTQKLLATVSADGGSVNQLTWARDGKWLLASTSPSA